MLIIRPYEPSDQDEMLRVWYEASVIAHHFVPPSFWAAERKAIVEEYVPIAETWVAEVDGRIIGSGTRGPLTEKLQSTFFDVVKGRNTTYQHWLTFI